MTELEKELRILLNKYNIEAYEISIYFNNDGKNILIIRFKESEK